MKKMFLIAATIFFSLALSAGEGEIYFSGDYNQVSFKLFAADIESKTGARFKFKTEWVEDIYVTAHGTNLKLSQILSESFSGKGLHFYFDSDNNVFILKGNSLVTSLPDYSTEEVQFPGTVKEKESHLTSTELTYKEGRKNGIIETVVIGDGSGATTRKAAVINGNIRDKESGEPLIGATVYIEELSKGYATDLNGHFVMTIMPGKYTATFNCLGMDEINYALVVNSSGFLNVEMDRKLIAINEVTIKADKFDNVRGIQMGYDRLSIKTIKEIPVVMGERDLLKVAQMLPGVQNVGEGSSGFNIRGSSADQNMFFINKVPVYNTSHLFGFFSAFNSEIVSDFSLYKCNIPAKYGGRLASFFDITSRQGNNKRYNARGGISPVTGHITAEGPIIKDRSSFIVSARSTYSDWILSRLHDHELRKSNAQFYDLAGNITIEPGQNDLIKLFGYYSRDHFTLATSNHYMYYNTGASLEWNHRFSLKLSSNTSLILARYAFQNTDTSNSVLGYHHGYTIDHYELKTDFTWIPSDRHLISYGFNVIRYGLDRGNVAPVGDKSEKNPVYLGTEKGLEGAFYLSDEYQLTRRLTFYAGIRYSIYGYLGPAKVFHYHQGSPRSIGYIADTSYYSNNEPVRIYSGPELRTALNYRTGNSSSVKLSYNRTRQYLFMLSNTIAISPTDQWKLCDYHIKSPYSDQYTIGYYKDMLRKGLSLSGELYFKKTFNVVEYQDGADFMANPLIETQALQGEQTAYGLELMLRKNSGKFTGWLAYCYSRSNILVDGMYAWEKINDGDRFPSNYDKPHAWNTVLNIRLNRQFSISSNIVYNTGRPVTYPISVYFSEGREYVYYSSRNEYRIPDYFRMDLSINIEGNLKASKPAHSYWMLSVYNLTGRKNAYSVFFQSENGLIKGYKMSIFGTPIVTLSWNIKLGNYASD
ncbi:MAG TPA: TonB-dependent receptor [Bacteroidales bacterium]|nr:TonB-dependent receptor [Bacteroidales bacterium]